MCVCVRVCFKLDLNINNPIKHAYTCKVEHSRDWKETVVFREINPWSFELPV